MRTLTGKIGWLLGLGLPVFLLDQVTKIWIDRALPLGESFPIIPGIFDIVHVRNRGAAFGFLANLSDPWRIIVFHLISVVALVVIVTTYWRWRDPKRDVPICLALIFGGALGNITDRLLRGDVVDFLSFHWYDDWVRWNTGWFRIQFPLEWPAFNVADVAITTSVLWLLIHFLFRETASA